MNIAPRWRSDKLDEVPEPAERNGNGRRAMDDWKQGAPRWFLVLLLLGASSYITKQSVENHYLEASLQDGPSKFQQRQGERLAALESEMLGVKRALETLTVEHKESNELMTRLATQVELSNRRR